MAWLRGLHECHGGAKLAREERRPAPPDAAAHHEKIGGAPVRAARWHGYFFEPRVRKRERNSLVRESFGASITCSGGPTSANSP